MYIMQTRVYYEKADITGIRVYYERTGTPYGNAPWALPMESRLLKRHQFREELKTGMQKPKSNSSVIREHDSFAATKTFTTIMAQTKNVEELLNDALNTFASTTTDGAVGEAAEAEAQKRPNYERGGSALRLGDIISFPTVEQWAKTNYAVFNFVGGCAVTIVRNGYTIGSTFLSSYFTRALREVKNGTETGTRIRCTGKPVDDFLAMGGTEASAIRSMAGAVIKVTAVKRVTCKVFSHTDTTVEPPVSIYRDGNRPVFNFEYIELPEALRPKTATPSGSKKGGAKPKTATPNPLP